MARTTSALSHRADEARESSSAGPRNGRHVADHVPVCEWNRQHEAPHTTLWVRRWPSPAFTAQGHWGWPAPASIAIRSAVASEPQVARAERARERGGATDESNRGADAVEGQENIEPKPEDITVMTIGQTTILTFITMHSYVYPLCSCCCRLCVNTCRRTLLNDISSYTHMRTEHLEYRYTASNVNDLT